MYFQLCLNITCGIGLFATREIRSALGCVHFVLLPSVLYALFLSVEVIRHLFLLVVLSLVSNHSVVAYEKTSDYFIAEIVVEVIESDLPKFAFSKCDSIKNVANTIPVSVFKALSLCP